MNPIPQPGLTDCYRACIASLLELDISKVPDFTWYDDAREFCVGLGFDLVYLPWDKSDRIYNTKFLAIAVGPTSQTPDDWFHAVIVQNGEVVHDPNPEPADFVDSPEYYLCLVPIDPAKALQEAP